MAVDGDNIDVIRATIYRNESDRVERLQLRRLRPGHGAPPDLVATDGVGFGKCSQHHQTSA
jgi:hypothetical protein